MSKYMPMSEGFAMDEAPVEFQKMNALEIQGIGFNAEALDSAMAYSMDEAPVTGGGVNNPWFELNYLAKKPIQVLTQRTTIDEILGRTKEGDWANASVTKQFRELTGRTNVYDDFVEGSVSRVNRAYSYETRDVIRLSAGLIVSELESRQAAMIPGQYSPNQDKREGVALLFQLDRDAIGYFGYRLGAARCWGLLNDPNLLPFEQVAAEGSGASAKLKWEDKSFHAIIRDLMTAVGKVQKRLKAQFVPATTEFKIVIPNECDQYLGKVPECGGKTVREWIKDQWPKAKVVVSPVFDGALGDENVFYVIVSKLGTSPAAEQIVPSSGFLVGSAKREVGHSELWSFATCGTFVEQPMGIGRYFGI